MKIGNPSLLFASAFVLAFLPMPAISNESTLQTSYYRALRCMDIAATDFFLSGVRAEQAVLAALPRCNKYLEVYSKNYILEIQRKLKRELNSSQALRAEAKIIHDLNKRISNALKGDLAN